MERLTTRNNFVLDNAINAYEHTADSAFDRCTLDFLKELREYRKLKEQGLLLKLPCKVGDTVYKVYSPNRLIEPYTYKTIVIQSLTQIVEYIEKGLWDKTVFLTKEEAEQALAE